MRDSQHTETNRKGNFREKRVPLRGQRGAFSFQLKENRKTKTEGGKERRGRKEKIQIRVRGKNNKMRPKSGRWQRACNVICRSNQ